jgi:D-amino-acid dehydrogenase
MDHYAETDRLLRESFGVAARRYDGDSLAQLEPALKPGLAGGWHYAGDAHLRPDRLLAEWRRVLEARGVLLREHCAVLGFEQSLGRATAVHTTGGVQAAESFVVAAGALTPELQPHLGCRIPIQPGKGYSITMPRPVRCPAIPLLFHEHRVVVTPLRSGYRLGSTMEFAGYDATINRHRLELLRSGARHYLHEPECDPVQEEWCGWRPMTYDSKPIIGPGPALPNVYVAAGHNMLGMSMAPATGKLIAELLTGDPPHIDPAPYALSRFR